MHYLLIALIFIRSSYCFLFAPPVFDSEPKPGRRDPDTSSPFRMAQCFSFECDKTIPASILGLLNGGSPTAITGLVMTVRIDSIQRVLFSWSRSHVTQEGSEVINPFFADSNPPSSVSMVITCKLVATPRLHRNPSVVFRGCSTGSGISVCGNRLPLAFISTIPPTALCFFGPKRLNGEFFPTL